MEQESVMNPDQQGRPKSFLLVTASIGSGHIKAASSVAEALKIKYPDASVNMVDFTAVGVSVVNAFMKWSYLTMLRFVPNLYELMYRFTGNRTCGGLIQAFLDFIMARDMRKLVRKYRPDAVICTHPFPSGAASQLKLYVKGTDEDFLSDVVITDYSVHQMWVYKRVDQYFVARKDMCRELMEHGLPESSLYPVGIPVGRQFVQLESREKLFQELKLDSSKPVLLIMGGGLGLGGMDVALGALEDLKQDVQIIVVAGKNQRLMAQVQAAIPKSHHDIRVYGYTDMVHKLMMVSSLLISKPGALTITEAMSCGLPILLHEPIPGPETDNAEYFAQCGTAAWIRSDEELGAKVKELLEHPEALEAMRRAAMQWRRPEAAEKIADYIGEALKSR